MIISDRNNILIVEDELLISMDMAAEIENLGHQVIGPARSCLAAIQLLQNNRIDAAIVDFVVGEEHCDVVADELDRQGIPWVLLTGFDLSAIPPRFRIVPPLIKPISSIDLKEALSGLLISFED